MNAQIWNSEMGSWQNSAKAKALKTVIFTKRKEIDLLTLYEKELHRLFG